MKTIYVSAGVSTPDVLAALRASGKPLQEWGQAVDGSPMLAARAGGRKQPAIFITAGAHSNEIAGVIAALNLLHDLETDHEVHILPLRDPFGFAGVNHCLSFAAGETVALPNHRAALEYLTARARLLWRERQLHLFRLGEFGFAWAPAQPNLQSYWELHALVRSLLQDHPQVLRPLWGKRLLLIDALPDSEGAGELQRCWHAVLTAAGQWSHLNRLFERPDAPGEVAAVGRLMEAVRPGLTCDLHEGHGVGFWLPIPKPANNPERVFAMAQAYFDYIHQRHYPVTDYADWRAGDRTPGAKDYMLPEPRLPGLFWVNTPVLGGGPNLMDYGGRFGIGFGTEGPMQRPLAMRVDGIAHGIQAVIRVWERTLA